MTASHTPITKPTLVQTLLNKPSQTYYTTAKEHSSLYHSAKQDMLRAATAVSPSPQSDRSLSEYFTPDSSPRSSMAPSTSRKQNRRSLTDSTDAVPSTRTPTTPSAQRAIYTLSTGSSLSSTSLDAHSIFSDYLTAAGSVDDLPTPTSYHPMPPAKSTVTPNRPTSVKPSSSAPIQTKERATKTLNGNPHRPFNAFAPLPTTTSKPNGSPPVPKPSPQNGHPPRELPPKPPSSQTMTSYHNRRTINSSKIPNSIMMNMSALLEEDEEAIGAGDNNTTTHKRPHLRHTTERGREKKQRSHAPNTTSLASSSSSDSTLQTPNPNRLHRQRSRSLDSGSTTNTPRSVVPAQTLSAEVRALTLASHGDMPSIGTQGYTSLVLPRAPMPMPSRSGGGGLFGHFSFSLPNWNKLSLGADGKVDLTKSGIAQTTMASVEVVRGLSLSGGGIDGVGVGGGGGARFGRSGSWKVLGALGRRGSTNSRVSSAAGSSSSADESAVAALKRRDDRILGFTSYRAPPSYVPSQSVLVQVWAVGVDGVDGRLVGVRFGSVNVNVKAKSEAEEGDESMELVEDEALTNSTSKNPFVALGRSLSLTLKRPPKTKEESTTTTTVGRSFSTNTNKKPDPPTRHNGTASRSKSGSATSTPEKKRSGTQSQHQRSKHQETSPPLTATPPKLPSKPLKLKAKTKAAVPVPASSSGGGGVQVHVETQTQTHSSAIEGSKQNEKENEPSTSTGVSLKPARSVKSKNKPRLLPRMPSGPPLPKPAEVGFIPGRSFVGRVLEVGWELGEEVIRKGEWVIGLFDVRKCGALAEFIVVDRHRIHRVPHPSKAVPIDNPNAAPSPIWVGDNTLTASPQQKKRDIQNTDDANKKTKKSTRVPPPSSPSMLTLEEMALLPLCGIPAYRAVRSFMYAFSSTDNNNNNNNKSPITEHTHHQRRRRRRRALVLRGHDGTGSMAVQMLIKRGWRVSVHVPFSCVPADANQELADAFMRSVEDRARGWGADEVIFDDGEAEDGDDGLAAAVRVLETLREEGDVFDAVLDTVGGKEVREAGERLLRNCVFVDDDDDDGGEEPVVVSLGKERRSGIGLFTTVVGDRPERPIPSAADLFRANLRSFRFGLNDGGGGGSRSGVGGDGSGGGANAAVGAVVGTGSGAGSEVEGTVGYAWVSVAHEVSEWEGADVRETLAGVLSLALEDGIRPLVEDVGGGTSSSSMLRRPRVVPFEKAPGVFVDNGPLRDGGTLVVRIAG